jgi:histidine phosphotransfer protein HptB
MSPIDNQVLESLMDMLGDDQEVLAEIINCYLVESPKMVNDIQTSATTQDADILSKTAHSFKSSSASVGAINLSELCIQLESKGKSGNLEGVLELVSQMSDEYAQVEIALKKIAEVS